MREVTIVSCKTPQAGICKRLTNGGSGAEFCEVRHRRSGVRCAITPEVSRTGKEYVQDLRVEPRGP